jgi:putative NADH-flavin reductase
MRILLLGATGRTGREVLAQALERGHEVAALVRSPEKIEGNDPRVTVGVGSVMDPVAVEVAMAGCEAVLSTLGNRAAGDLFGTSLMTDTVRALLPAMKRHGVERLVVLSAVGVGQSAAQAPALIRLGFRTALRAIAKDKARSEDEIRASGLDWTIAYPPALTSGPLTKSYRAGEDLRLEGMAKVSRADVAHFMLEVLQDPAFSKKNAVISST